MKKYTLKLVLFMTFLLLPALPFTVFSQTTKNTSDSKNGGKQISATKQILPVADHHTHLWSLDARTPVMGPVLPAVELPEELKRLLRDRELLVKEKNPSILAPLYTEDAVVLDAMAPIWLRGKDAVNFVAHSLGSFPLLAQDYKIEGSAGYIVGTYTVGEGASLDHVANFSLFIRKGADGKWRISGETLTLKGPPVPKAATAEQLVEKMDDAGVKRAAVLSVAFWFGSSSRETSEDEYAKVRAENDWLAEQVSRFPDRLVGLCSFNPLKSYALEELERCTKSGRFKGLKLHFGSSDVNLLNPQHMEKVMAVFRAANEKRFPVVAHLLFRGKYGREHSEPFLNQILPAAPDIPIQIAHLAGSGPGYDADEALEVFANAAAAKNTRVKNLYFDTASNVTNDQSDATLALIAKGFRQIGLQKILFAPDYAPGGSNSAPKQAWEAFRRLPLTENEFNTIAGLRVSYYLSFLMTPVVFFLVM